MSTKRATPLPPSERRAAIIAASRHLILERGTEVTSRQLADAAQVSEGTIFNVFESKDALIDAVIDAILDHTDSEQELLAINRDAADRADFARLLIAATAIVQHRITANWQLLSRIGTNRKPRSLPASPGLVAIFERHHHFIRLDPLAASHFLRALTWSLSAPQLTSQPDSPEHIVDLFLNGAGS